MILVTGATGFLGTELIKQLTSAGHAVRALKRSQSTIPEGLLSESLIEWAEADINDIASLETAFEGISEVYHCAAMVSFNPADKSTLFRVNIKGTANVVNLCLEVGARLLHVSSIAALGHAKNDGITTEDDQWEYGTKTHAYSISKYEGEMEVWRGIAEGLDAVIVNPSVIIGVAAGSEGSGKLFKLIRQGFRFYTKGATGLVDVYDVARIMILLMNSPERSERFILSSENLSFKALFSQIAKASGLNAPDIEAKRWMLNLAWAAGKLKSIFSKRPSSLTRDAIRSSLRTSLYSNKKITQTFGITFKPVDQSIADICASLTT